MRYAPTALVLVALLSGCSGLRHATSDDPLFAGYTVEWSTKPEMDASLLHAELMAVVRPTPNTAVLGMRPSVALHNAIRKPKKERGLGVTLKYRIGSPPVQLAEVPLADIDAALANRMQNRGYFAARAQHAVTRKDRTATVCFTVDPGPVYRIRTILYGGNNDSLSMALATTHQRSTLKTNERYDLDQLRGERERVVESLRNRGYYGLRADHLRFKADSVPGERLLDLHLVPAPDIPEAATYRYRIGTVRVHGDHDPLLTVNDTMVVDDLVYINYRNNYRPRTITRGVYLQTGKPYSQRAQENTTRYLGGYGAFSSVNIDLRPDSLHPDVLNADVFLSPLKRWSLFYELNTIAKSNNFMGPGLKVGLKDRNLFRGAELLTMDLNGRFETQMAGATRGTNAYEVSAKASLSIPRIVPFRLLRSARSHVPSTRIDMGYGLFRRLGLYGLESANTGISWLWRPDARQWHDLKLVDISYGSLYYSSGDFDAFLERNPAVRRSFSEQFIVGSGYTYSLSSRDRGAARARIFASFGVDVAGNLLYAAMGGFGTASEDEGYQLFDRRFAQFARFRPEFRWNKPLGAGKSSLATRMQVGVAVPYGNSTIVPYVRQFFVGGPNSLRGFQARSVGPGTYMPTSDGAVLIDQTGEIKFEANLEYRFPINGYFKGALFTDAGNIWLMNDDPDRPGGHFAWDRAMDELAVDGGFGLRFDAEVIVVRFDLAVPLRRPSLPQGDRWTFNDQDPRILRNMVFNIAIGYPF